MLQNMGQIWSCGNTIVHVRDEEKGEGGLGDRAVILRGEVQRSTNPRAINEAKANVDLFKELSSGAYSSSLFFMTTLFYPTLELKSAGTRRIGPLPKRIKADTAEIFDADSYEHAWQEALKKLVPCYVGQHDTRREIHTKLSLLMRGSGMKNPAQVVPCKLNESGYRSAQDYDGYETYVLINGVQVVKMVKFVN